MEHISAFTLRGNGYLNMLKTDAYIQSNIKNDDSEHSSKKWRSLWDTGASMSSISPRIVEDLSLIPIGKILMSTANGTIPCDTYLVDIILPNHVTIKDVRVSCCDLGTDADILIGMDIIQLGDFSISNADSKTTFSFRIPSIKEVDYVKEIKNEKK